ncbi:MAG: glycosyltransferase [Bacteroidales bacterium]
MRKKSMYLYPITARFNTGLYNPYVDDFIEAMSSDYTCVNRAFPSKSGVFNILRFWRKTDVFFLNWIEDLPDKKGGFLQMFFLLGLFPLIKLSGKQVVWTIHNKRSHEGRYLPIKRWFANRLMNTVNFMLTHAKEGIRYVEQETNATNAQRVFYFPHPVKPRILPKRKEKQPATDVLIWGTMAPYKGIHKFLRFLHEEDPQHTFSVRIMGKIPDPEYKNELKSLATDRVQITDKFVSAEELNAAMAETSCILFTYSPEYVLSSGVLADSIGAGKRVLGPHAGAFADLQEEGLVTTYADFSDCMMMIKKILETAERNGAAITPKKLTAYNWEAYAQMVTSLLMKEQT